MGRLCERPGCSELASVAYGMRAEDLVFWLDALGDDDADGSGVLCRRHADSMVVPRGWTLDDLRDPDLHLFRPPAPASKGPSRSRRSRADRGDGEQLALGVDDLDQDAAEGAVSLADDPAASADTEGELADGDDAVGHDETVDGDEVVEAWTPRFDDGDDLDGLLSARGPLLARAFRGADRPPRR